MRVLWLATVLRAEGLTVVEHSGWKTRGFEPWSPQYGIAHATAAPRSQSDADQVRIVRDGHSTLAGPIANCCVDRTGRWHVLASGRCNTAKVGWAGPANGKGNTNLLGVEACNDNGFHKPPETWPTVQYNSYFRGWAAICRKMGWPASRVIGHKEHQPGDKSDPLFNMSTFRNNVSAVLSKEEDDDVSWSKWSAKERKDAAEAFAAAVLAPNAGKGSTLDLWGKNAASLDTWVRRAANEALKAKRLAAENAGQLAALTTMVEQLAQNAGVTLTDAQIAQLADAMVTAGSEAGEVLARITAAGEALSGSE